MVELRCSLLLHVLGVAEFGTGGGALIFAPLVVRSGEESLKTGPSFFLCSETFPGFAVINLRDRSDK